MADTRSDARPIDVAVLNDYPLVVEGLAAMLRSYPDRVHLTNVSTDARHGESVDILLYDTFGETSAGADWSSFVGQGWDPQYVVRYCWEGRDDRGRESAREIEVPKSLGGEDLVAALEEIHATGSYVPNTERGGSEVESEGRRWPGQQEGLTERQAEVVALVVAGLSNEELASRLFLGVNTIKTYVRAAYRKMGVTTRSEAVLWGVDHGLRRPEPE